MHRKWQWSLVVALIAMVPAAAFAQGEGGVIRGTVVAGDSGRPLVAASVVVRSAADSTAVASELTDASGAFRIAGIRPGRYVVEATFLGYAPFATPAVALASSSDTIDVGTLRLSLGAIALEGVVVETERAPVRFAADRTIYGVEAMPVASGGTATDVLRSIPELEVDIEGAVTLRGSTPEIYLNGRPAPMEGEALRVFLQQFPADRIERVEVISNPSARYDAEGSAGIVNIVLKDDVDLGLSGSVFANGGSRGNVGGGGRLAYQRGRLTLFGGSFLRYSDQKTSTFDLRQNLVAEPTTFLRQDARSDRTGLWGSADLTAQLEFGERAMVWAEAQIYDSGSDGEHSMTTTHMDADLQPTEQYDRLSASESRRLTADVSTGFRKTFESSRHELSAELEYRSGDEDEDERVETQMDFVTDAATLVPPELTLEDVANEQRETSLKVDYTRPWGEDGRIELGYRGDIEDVENDRLLRLFTGAADPSETPSGFAHHEMFNSVYLTMSRRLGDLGVQLGLRAERADTRFELPSGESFENDYASLFPSANISYDLGGGRRLRLSYSRRIRRPSPRILNPINESTDPLNRYVGNPDIAPQYAHSVSLDASWTGPLGTLRISPYYRRSVDDWAQIKRVDADGVSTVTWENIASTASYGTSVTLSFRPIHGWSGFVGVSGDREERDASNLAYDYSGSSLRLSAHGNIAARLTPSLSLQTMVFYSPPRDVPQGRVSSRIMTHVGLRQRFWDDRASLNLAITDPFDWFDTSFETRDPTHVQVGSSDYSMRSVRLSFSYSFGRPPEDARRPAEEMEPEPEIRIR